MAVGEDEGINWMDASEFMEKMMSEVSESGEDMVESFNY